MGTQELNENSHLTAIERESLSFPAKTLFERGLLTGKVLDYGCGFGSDAFYLNNKGVRVTAYDPHYFPEQPDGLFDTIICFYVLNVLHEDEQEQVHRNVTSLLKPGGKAYFAVRRDIRFEGFRMHKVHQKKTFQCLVHLPYKSVLRNEFCEIYEYSASVESRSPENLGCPFCSLTLNNEILSETPSAIAILDGFPVNPGHALIIPKIHVADYFQLELSIQAKLWGMVNHVKGLLSDRFHPDGYNVGINCGEIAGQTVPHVHIHLIPRYKGDVEDPRGGVRGVIPHKRSYLP